MGDRIPSSRRWHGQNKGEGVGQLVLGMQGAGDEEDRLMMKGERREIRKDKCTEAQEADIKCDGCTAT